MADFPNSVFSTENPTQFHHVNDVDVPLADQVADLNDEVTAIEEYLLNGEVEATAVWRMKEGYIWVKNPSGGGTPWHKVYPVVLEDSTLSLVVNPTGEA